MQYVANIALRQTHNRHEGTVFFAHQIITYVVLKHTSSLSKDTATCYYFAPNLIHSFVLSTSFVPLKSFKFLGLQTLNFEYYHTLYKNYLPRHPLWERLQVLYVWGGCGMATAPHGFDGCIEV
jgi:hypothetical protein